MKIYFSGSIRGGRQDANIYHQLIKELKTYGEVLTEHIGSKLPNEEPSDKIIHNQDMRWLKEADILIGEVTNSSHGVGYEIGRAVAMNKKIICLHRNQTEKTVSAMINGSPTVKCFHYSEIDEAKEILKQVFLTKTSISSN